jgi:hypothetical protein
MTHNRSDDAPPVYDSEGWTESPADIGASRARTRDPLAELADAYVANLSPQDRVCGSGDSRLAAAFRAGWTQRGLSRPALGAEWLASCDAADVAPADRSAVRSFDDPPRPLCETCRNWEPCLEVDGVAERGECRAALPQIVGLDEIGRWPATAAGDGCAQHSDLGLVIDGEQSMASHWDRMPDWAEVEREEARDRGFVSVRVPRDDPEPVHRVEPYVADMGLADPTLAGRVPANPMAYCRCAEPDTQDVGGTLYCGSCGRLIGEDSGAGGMPFGGQSL